MAGPRPLMSLIDSGRRDRITGARLPQQRPVAVAASVGAGGGSVGFQTLQQQHHPHFSLAHHQRFDGLEEEEVGRMAGGGGGGSLWSIGHEQQQQQQQRALATDAASRQRRVNAIQPLPNLSNSLIQQGPGPGGQPMDWDGGGVVRHIGSISARGRMDRNSLADEQQIRLRQQQQQQSVVNPPRGGGEFPRGGNSREVFQGGLRLRDSRDGFLSDELMKSGVRSHVSLLDDTARVEMPRSYQQRPAAVVQQQQQQQRLDPLTRNRGARFGVEENGHAELIARYGDRSSSRNLERAHDAIGRGYQLENLSKKRTREEEEADLDRERLIRHRKLSGIDSPSPPQSLPLRSPQSSFQQLKERNQEIQQHKAAKYWQLQAEENNHNAHVQHKERNQGIHQHKAKYWQQLQTEEDEHRTNFQHQRDRNLEIQQHKSAKNWQQLQKEEDERKAKVQRKERNQEIQQCKAAKYWQQEIQQCKAAKYWQQLQAREDDHKANVQPKERSQEIQQHNAKYWKFQTEEDEHEDGQVTPPPPIITHKPQQQHSIESKINLLKQEQDLVVISSRMEATTPKVEVKVTGPRNQSGSAYFPGALEFLPSSRPQSRSSRSPIPEADDVEPFGRSTEQSSILTRERAPPSPCYKNNERTLRRLERVSAGFESNSILASEFSDMCRSREGIRESQNHTSALSCKSAGRFHHDGPHQKHQHQQQVQDILPRDRDLRSLNCRDFRDTRSGGAELDSLLLERLRKESSGRTENIVKRKITSKTTAAAKDNRLVGEMTISLQKHGQRIVKVEEYTPRDTTQSRVTSQMINKDQRLLPQRGGGLRGGSGNLFLFSSGRDRAKVGKRKEYDGRSPAATQEKTLRLNSSPHQQYLEKPTLQDRFPPYPQLVKDELTARTEKYEPEPHRHKSIFTRLVGLRPETNPTSTPAESKRKDIGLLPVHDKPSLPSSSRKSPSVPVQISALNDMLGSPHEFPGFQISTTTRSTYFSREFEDSALKHLNRRNSVTERVPCEQAEPCELPNKGSQNVQAQDDSPRNELARKPQLESVVSRLSHSCHKVLSPSDQGVEVLETDLRLLESPKLQNPDQSKSRQEGFALPSGDSGYTPRLFSSDMAASDGFGQLPGNGLKVHPKVIATGHKKDQILKKHVLDAEKVVQRSSSLPVEAVIPVDNSHQEKAEGRLSILSPGGGLPGPESPSTSSKAERFGSSTSLLDCEHNSPQSDLGVEKPMSKGKPSEVVTKNMQSVGPGSTPTGSRSPTEIEPSKASLDAVEIEQPNPPPAVESSCLQPLEGVSKTVVVELHGESETGLSVAPLSSSALLTPKEVRLFGANLNAQMGERIDITPKALGSLDQYVVECSKLPTEDQDKDSVSVEKNSDCIAVIQGLAKPVCPQVGRIGDEPLSPLDKPVKAEQSLLIPNDGLKDLKSTAHDPSSGQVQVEESLRVPREQHWPLPQLQKATAAALAQGGQLSSSHASHATGAHTWRRGTSSSSAPVSNGNVFRSTSSFGGVIQSAARSKSPQSTAYVRKGNSLVRARGAANFPPTNDITAGYGLSGQARPLARKLPMMKPVPLRNTFIANTTTSKPYFSTSRKYVASVSESDAAFASSVRPVNPPKLPDTSNDLGKSQSSESAMMKIPPKAPLRASEPQFNSSTLSIPQQEQQTEVTSSPELPVLHRPDGRSVAGGVCRSLDNTSASLSTDVTLLPGNQGTRVLDIAGIANRLYVRRKANQLVVASAQNSKVLTVGTERIQASKTGHMLGHYFKRKTNQLVRSISGKGSSTRNLARNSLGMGLSSNLPDEQGGGSTLVLKKIRRGRGVRLKKDSPGRSSWVWTLNGGDVGHTNNHSAESRRTGALLFPWKRQNSLRTPVRSQKLRPLPEVKKGSFLFLMSKRLRKVRPVQPVYTRSADGFSLHRSGVMSVGGGNLKWTKSLEKRAKEASEEVTKAVAEAERRKREKKEAVLEAAAKAKDEKRAVRKAARGEGERIVWVGLVRYKMDAASKTLQRVPDSQGEAGDTEKSTSTGWAMTSPLLTPRRSIIGGTVYLRVGNGNQLVRDPKTASRALASEKVRWSLHNARSRGAKKQQYCQFFTKFGKCNKESGKCPYIHDPEKVAVCTKFLKGNCTDVHCPLTHKVIPERMPDCSFFLEGLCTNENCSYRHVKVNPKASYCDGFLRGYCKDGDKCNKKHTYICSVYAETGECPDRSTCKFHHPKKKVKPDAPVSGHNIDAKRKRRYFSTAEAQPIRHQIDVKNLDEISTAADNGQTPNDGSMEFISLTNIESDEEQTVMSASQPWPEPGLTFTINEAAFAEEIEKRIKPTFLLQMTASTAAAH